LAQCSFLFHDDDLVVEALVNLQERTTISLSDRLMQKQLPDGSMYLGPNVANSMIRRIREMEKKILCVQELMTQRVMVMKEFANSKYRKRVNWLKRALQLAAEDANRFDNSHSVKEWQDYWYQQAKGNR
jgi:Mg2+ and Co2+ transporter CorA